MTLDFTLFVDVWLRTCRYNTYSKLHVNWDWQAFEEGELEGVSCRRMSGVVSFQHGVLCFLQDDSLDPTTYRHSNMNAEYVLRRQFVHLIFCTIQLSSVCGSKCVSEKRE